MTSSLTPDYEVRALLKPSETADSDNKLKKAVRKAFFAQSSTKKMKVQFVDTQKQDYYTNGWSLRVRRTEGDEEFELTYKKRYQIGTGPLSNAAENVAAALKAAEQDGFGSSAAFKAQVEVGHDSQTLSLSHDATVSDEGFEGIDLPLADDSGRFLAENAPEELGNLGTSHLAKSVVYGPVLATRTKGTWSGLKLFIEVWLLRTSKTDATLVPVVEASFKTPDAREALEGQAKLVGFLQDKGWFLPEDSLKTKLIMERYGVAGEGFPQ